MQRKSWMTAAALAGGLALGLVFGPTITDTASAQTDTPPASATPSASAVAVPDDCPARGAGGKRTPGESTAPQASPAASTATDV